MVEIIPAILTRDFETLHRKIHLVEKLCDKVQIDFLDDTLVAGKTITPKELKELDNLGKKLFLEAHLMVDHPERYLLELVHAGVRRVIFQIESRDDPEKVARKIKTLGMDVGLAFNPWTPIVNLGHLVRFLDEVLILSVKPGKQGQEFCDSVLSKIPEISDLYPKLLIGVDGGINEQNAPLLEASGANIIYVGNYFWKNKAPKAAFQKLILALNRR